MNRYQNVMYFDRVPIYFEIGRYSLGVLEIGVNDGELGSGLERLVGLGHPLVLLYCPYAVRGPIGRIASTAIDIGVVSCQTWAILYRGDYMIVLAGLGCQFRRWASFLVL